MKNDKQPNNVVRLKPVTRKKVEQIATAHRWKLGEAIDAAVDHFLATANRTPLRTAGK